MSVISKNKMSWFVGIIAIGISLLLFISMGPGSARSNAYNFLEEVAAGHYDKAFDYVYYFNNAYDEDVTISYDDAKNIWVKQAEKLKNEGTYLKSFEDFDLRHDDGWPKGYVKLTVVVKGEEKHFDTVHVSFNKRDGKWKVGSLFAMLGTDKEEWENAYSGYVGKR